VKTLLVLAASIYQLDVINRAKTLGHRVVTTDNRPDNPGHALADRSYAVDTTEKEEILRIAIKEKIDGIIAAGTDVAVPTASYVSGHLNLPGCSLSIAETALDKLRFRDFQERGRFPVPEFQVVTRDFRPSPDFLQNGPRILKPDRSSGSKGIYVLATEEDFYCHVEDTLSFSPEGMGVLEEYIDGFQLTCEGIINGRELEFVTILDRQTASLPFTTTIGHRVPTRLSRETQRRVRQVLSDMWKRLGIVDGPFDCDLVILGDSIYVLELAPRLGGNSINRLLYHALNFDIAEFAIKYALDENPSMPEDRGMRPTAVVLLGADTPGKLSYSEREFHNLSDEAWVLSLAMDYPPGTTVEAFKNGRHRVGEALVCGESRRDLDRRVEQLRARLNVRTL